jgi:anti-sigma regulatory factor (Ser/Thr protein kinase)
MMGPFDASLPPTEDRGRSLRVELRDWMSPSSIEHSQREDVLLVVSELFSNAVLATEDHSHIVIHVTLGSDGLNIAVSNHGSGFDLSALPVPLLNQRRGRGLAIAQKLGRVTVEQVDQQTTVRVAITSLPIPSLPIPSLPQSEN